MILIVNVCRTKEALFLSHQKIFTPPPGMSQGGHTMTDHQHSQVSCMSRLHTFGKLKHELSVMVLLVYEFLFICNLIFIMMH